MLESRVQTKIKKHLQDNGWYVIRLISCTPNNLPDLIAFKKQYTLWIEVKTETGRCSKLQEFRHRDIKKTVGHDVMVPYGWDDYKKKYKELFA